MKENNQNTQASAAASAETLDAMLHAREPLAWVVEGKPPTPILRADTFGRRFLGLMGTRDTGRGLWLSPCDAIHMMFMRYALDAVFLDRAGRIVSIRRQVKPWGFAFGGKGAHSVIELPASLGLAAGLVPGMQAPLQRLQPS